MLKKTYVKIARLVQTSGIIVEEIKKDVMRGNTMKKHIIELIKLYE